MLANIPRKRQRVAICSSCGHLQTVALSATEFVCNTCSAPTSIERGNVKLGRYECPHCQWTFTIPKLPKHKKPLIKRLFAVEYECDTCMATDYKTADEKDQQQYRDAAQKFQSMKRRLPFPRTKIPTRNRSDPRPINYGYRTYSDLFNPRQLLGLSILYRRISKVRDTNTKEYLLLAFSDSLASNNMFCYYAFDYRKLTPMFGLHAFRPVPRPVEVNLLQESRGRGSFPKCVEKVIRGKRFCYRPYEYVSKAKNRSKRVHTGETIVTTVTNDYADWESGAGRCLLTNRSSESLPEIKKQVVDLIVTDPPYYDNIPYAEYSDFYYVWLRRYIDPQSAIWKSRHVPFLEPLYVNPKDREIAAARERYTVGLSNVFKECRRVIKPRGVLVFSYHHLSNEAWESLTTAIVQGEFRVTNVIPLRSEGKSGFHSHEGSLKWDSILVCRPVLRKTSRQEGSAKPHAVARWATSRVNHWSARVGKLGMSESDKKSLRMALVCARLTQLRVSQAEIAVAFHYNESGSSPRS